jgi:hypothetical protein
MTGMTGATGPVVGQNFRRVNLDVMQAVANGGFITMGPTVQVGGTAITQPNFQTLNLAPNQIYSASYNIQATSNGTGGVQVNFQGVAGSGTVSTGNTVGDVVNLSNSIVFNSNELAALGYNLRLINNSPGGATGFQNVQVSVVKVA